MVNQDYVKAVLNDPDSEAERLILADAYEDDGKAAEAVCLRAKGMWTVDMDGYVRWVKEGAKIHSVYKQYKLNQERVEIDKVKFGKTRSWDVPSIKCAMCGKKYLLVRRDGAWHCTKDCPAHAKTPPGEEG